MRTLVLGGTGMLGRAVVGEARRRGWPALGLSRLEADLRDRERLRAAADAYRPELVVNCAALTRVDDCEARRELALEVNGAAVANAVALAEAAAAPLVQVSSDYVFDGRSTTPHTEEAAPSPLSAYGESKLAGERRALAYPRALVVRTSWVFGPGGANFVATMVRQIEAGRLPLRVVDDQVGCPTYTRFLASALLELAARRQHGLVHYRNREPVSWFDFAREIAASWRLGVEVLPISTAEAARPAPRPPYSVLAVERYQSVTGRAVEPWAAGLQEYLEELRSRRS
jgi:dTDP-4-dehydrorhamnose reductase